MRRVLVEAPAKVNLFLGVHDELDDRGYHRVDSLMCCVDVADLVEVCEADALSVACEPPVDVPARSNTCWRAVEGMAAAFGREPAASVRVEKRVPDRAGLGGSSADAAAAIVGLCALWGEDPRDPRCFAVARSVGADVPFFLEGLPTYLAGAGDEVVETFPAIEGASLVLVRPVRPGSGITAGEAYDEYDRAPVAPGSPDEIRAALRASRWERLPELLENNLEPVAERIVADVARARRWLSEREGVLRAMVTGSGSCVFALCASAAHARAAAREAVARGLWSHAGTVVDHGPRVTARA